MAARSSRTPSPIKPFPVLNKEQTVRVLTVKEALRFVQTASLMNQSQQAWAQMAQDFGIDLNGNYRLDEDTAELIQVQASADETN